MLSLSEPPDGDEIDLADRMDAMHDAADEEAPTIYAVHLGSGSTEFACDAHLHEALQELGVNEAIVSTGEAAATWDCSWC